MKGEGWSSPIAWGDQVFLTEAVPVESTKNSGDTKPEEYRGGGGSRRDDLTNRTYRWQVVSVDARTGSELWRETAREGRPVMPRHSSNTYATETPITDGERVYAYFGMMGIYCYGLAGQADLEKGSRPLSDAGRMGHIEFTDLIRRQALLAGRQ